MEMFDSLVGTVSGMWDSLGKPMWQNESASRFSFGNFSMSPAQKLTATKAGVVFLGIAGVAAGVALVAKAWTESYGSRKEVDGVKPFSLIPKTHGIKETIMNPANLFGRIKLLFSQIVPFAAGIVSLAAGAAVFCRFDQVLKAVTKK